MSLGVEIVMGDDEDNRKRAIAFLLPQGSLCPSMET